MRYEDLVEDPETTLRSIVAWLGLAWFPGLLDHTSLARPVPLSPLETTGDQVSRPLYTEAVHRWRGNIPQQVLRDNHMQFAATLNQFGYATFH